MTYCLSNGSVLILIFYDADKIQCRDIMHIVEPTPGGTCQQGMELKQFAVVTNFICLAILLSD